MACGDTDANHLEENCPKPTQPRSNRADTDRCKVSHCLAHHSKHECKVCLDKDSNHDGRDCPTGTKLYHQTSEQSVLQIMASRYMKKGTEGACGGGIYFAVAPEMTKLKAHHKGYMIVARVWLGKPMVVDFQNRKLTGADVHKAGYDSVHCIRDQKNRKKDEWVVYDWSRASLVKIYPCTSNGQHIVRNFDTSHVTFMKSPTFVSTPAIVQAAHYVNTEFFSKPYANEPNKAIQLQGKKIFRPLYGLVHNLRVIAYVPLVVDVCQLNVTIPEIEKIQIALLFFVSGRKSESSAKDYEDSAKNFQNYALKNQWDDEDILRFENCIKEPVVPPSKVCDPALLTMIVSRELDLIRYRTEKDYDSKCLSKVKNLFGTKKNPCDVTILVRMVKAYVNGTGDKMFGGGFANERVFADASTSVDKCFEYILKTQWQ